MFKLDQAVNGFSIKQPINIDHSVQGQAIDYMSYYGVYSYIVHKKTSVDRRDVYESGYNTEEIIIKKSDGVLNHSTSKYIIFTKETSK